MQKFIDNVTDLAGNAVSGVTVTVVSAGTGTLATLFADSAGVTPIGNPITTGVDGVFSFFAPNGRYNITVVKGSALSRVVNGVLLYDVEDDTRVTTPAPTGGTGTGTGSGNRDEVLLVPDANNVITPDGTVSNRFRFVMTSDVKLADPVNFTSKEHIYLTGYQDTTGGHKLSYGLSILLPAAQPYVPPSNGKAGFLMELRPTVNMATNALNWAMWGYPDRSMPSGFGLVVELAFINGVGYYTLAAAFGQAQNGQTIEVRRNGLSAEATGAFLGTSSNHCMIAGVPVPANGADQRPVLQLLTTDFGEGPPRGANRPAFGKAIIDFEGNSEVTVRDLIVTGARNDESNAIGITMSQSGVDTAPNVQHIVIKNVKIFNCNNGILTGNSSLQGSLLIEDSVFDANGVGGPNHSADEGFNSSGYVHNIYMGHTSTTLTINRSTFSNCITGHNIKTRADITVLNQVLTHDAAVGRELNAPNGGSIRATNCIFDKSGGATQNNLVGIGEEGIDTSRTREYIFTNCRFQNDINVPGRDVTFFINYDPTVRMQFIDCEFIGDLTLNNNLTPVGTNGMTTKNGIRFMNGLDPIITLTGGPIGPLLPAGYQTVPMTAIGA